MKVVSYRRRDASESVGILREDLQGPLDLVRAMEVYAAAHDQYWPEVEDMLDLLDLEMLNVAVLKRVETYVADHDLLEDLQDVEHTILAPIARPRAIYALGRNFPAHAAESGADAPEEPIIFGKAPTAVIGPDEEVVYKKWLTRVDPEAELAVVIGKTGSDISEEDAASYIAGYTIVNDVTARDIQGKDLAQGHPWLRSKGIDTFCPMGPNITLTDEISHPIELEVELRVNGELRQKDNTRSLTFGVPYLISWISRYHTLYPGDVISTGTPKGMKPVVPGDVMEASVEGIGVLRNKVVAE